MSNLTPGQQSRAILFILDDSEEKILIENENKFLPVVNLNLSSSKKFSSKKGANQTQSHHELTSQNLPPQCYAHKLLNFDNLVFMSILEHKIYQNCAGVNSNLLTTQNGGLIQDYVIFYKESSLPIIEKPKYSWIEINEFKISNTHSINLLTNLNDQKIKYLNWPEIPALIHNYLIQKNREKILSSFYSKKGKYFMKIGSRDVSINGSFCGSFDENSNLSSKSVAVSETHAMPQAGGDGQQSSSSTGVANGAATDSCPNGNINESCSSSSTPKPKDPRKSLAILPTENGHLTNNSTSLIDDMLNDDSCGELFSYNDQESQRDLVENGLGVAHGAAGDAAGYNILNSLSLKSEKHDSSFRHANLVSNLSFVYPNLYWQSSKMESEYINKKIIPICRKNIENCNLIGSAVDSNSATTGSEDSSNTTNLTCYKLYQQLQADKEKILNKLTDNQLQTYIKEYLIAASPSNYLNFNKFLALLDSRKIKINCEKFSTPTKNSKNLKNSWQKKIFHIFNFDFHGSLFMSFKGEGFFGGIFRAVFLFFSHMTMS